MSHRFIEDEATADIAFEARGKDLPEVFRAASDAVINVMVDNYTDIQPSEHRKIEATADALDLLLLDLLQNLIYYKDAERLLLRITQVEISGAEGNWHLNALGEGERIDSKRHLLRVDVKAVTLHNFRLEQTPGGWLAHVILDI